MKRLHRLILLLFYQNICDFLSVIDELSVPDFLSLFLILIGHPISASSLNIILCAPLYPTYPIALTLLLHENFYLRPFLVAFIISERRALEIRAAYN